MSYWDETPTEELGELEDGEEFDEEPDPLWGWWYEGDKSATYDTYARLVDVVAEMFLINRDHPEELPGWRVKNLESGQEFTGEAILASHGHLLD